MQRKLVTGMSLFVVALGMTASLWLVDAPRVDAHCQVPCGIYDDQARIARLKEDAKTIDKAVDKIKELAGQHDPAALNQVTRWINTKEQHASHIIEVVAQYFLTQKVKQEIVGSPQYQGYLLKLHHHHAVLVAAMKAKQTVDDKVVRELRYAISTLGRHYEK